jgi:hypothetical protein
VTTTATATTVIATTIAMTTTVTEAGQAPNGDSSVGTFANFRNAGLDRTTVSEIVTATPDGRTLIYTDAEGAIGFIDITNPARPVAAGTVAVDPDPAAAPAYSPTSVTVWRDRYVLVAVDSSVSKKHPSGELQVLDLTTRGRVATIDLGGQPDSVKVSPDGRYIAVVVENERDETLCVGGTANDQTVSESACTAGGGRLGGMPQDPLGNPAGYLAVIETAGPPAAWSRTDVSLIGYANRFPNDPEPEFVDINRKNQAVVTLQGEQPHRGDRPAAQDRREPFPGWCRGPHADRRRARRNGRAKHHRPRELAARASPRAGRRDVAG